MDVVSTERQMQWLLSNEDPATQEADMSQVAQLYEAADANEATQITRDVLVFASDADKAEVYAHLARRLSVDQLIGVRVGLSGRPQDQGHLEQAVRMQADGMKWPLYSAANKAITAEEARIQKEANDPVRQREVLQMQATLVPNERLDGHAMYRVFMRDPQVMAQRAINEHCDMFPGAVTLKDGPSTKATVIKALSWSPGQLTDVQQDRLEKIVHQIGEIGGAQPTLSVVPVVYAIDDPKGGIVKTSLFAVRNEDNRLRYVDDLGRSYDSLQDYRHNNGLPPDGVKLAMPARTPPQRDEQGNVKLYIADARVEGGFERFRRVTHADLVLGTGGFVAGATLFASAAGLIAVPASLVAAAGATFLGGNVWGAGVSLDSVVDRASHGQTINPFKSSDAALSYLNLGLSAAGVGNAARLTRMGGAYMAADKELRLAAQAIQQGEDASAHFAAARGFVQQGEALKAATPDGKLTPWQRTLAGGNVVGLLGNAASVYEHHDDMHDGELDEHLLMLGLNVAGFAMHAAAPSLKTYVESSRTTTTSIVPPLPGQHAQPVETLLRPAADPALPQGQPTGTSPVPLTEKPDATPPTPLAKAPTSPSAAPTYADTSSPTPARPRYDTTLTVMGGQQHHVVAGVERAASSLQHAERIAVVVGSNNVAGAPNSDGFTGAVELGRALQQTGKQVSYVVGDQQGAQLMDKLLRDMGHTPSRERNEIVVFDPLHGTDAKQQANTMLDELGSDHVVAIDVASRNGKGRYNDPRGLPIEHANAPLDEIVRMANQRDGVVTIGIGSDGNEAGMKGLWPLGERSADVATDHSITAWNASLGAQALGVEVARVSQAPAGFRPTDWQREVSQQTLVRGGAQDEGIVGSPRVPGATVKGQPAEVHLAMAKLLDTQATKAPGQIGYRFNAGDYRVVAAFDSSNGGILAAGTLASALQRSNSGPVRFVVTVDHGNAPYGRRDPKLELPRLVNNALTATEGIGPASGTGVGDVQVIAMACNTACTPTKTIYANGVDVPVIDLIDTTLNQMVQRGGAHPVSVSTVPTATSHAYGDGLARLVGKSLGQSTAFQRTATGAEGQTRFLTEIEGPANSNAQSTAPTQITEIGAPTWADIVNDLDHRSTDPGRKEYVAREVGAIVDQIPEDATSVWLTCTHYPSLKENIQRALLARGRDIEVIDPMESQASAMSDVLRDTAPANASSAYTVTLPTSAGSHPPQVILTSGSENRAVPASARALSGRKDALVFSVPSFDPSEPALKDAQGYIHDALSPDGSPYDPLLVAFNSRSIAKLHDNGRIEAAALATRNANKVVMLTNFNVAEGMPETDGPPGAALLGHAYASVGKDVTYVVSDEPARTVLRAALKEVGVSDAKIEIFDSPNEAEARVRAEHLLKRLNPDAVVAVETPARTETSGPVNMRGVPIGSFNSPLYEITALANQKKGVVTVGVYDGGNEIGAGNVGDRVPLALDGKTNMASDIPVDYPVAGWNSNFGAATLGLEVLRQHNRLNLAPSSEQVVNSIEATLKAGAVDGVTRGRVAGERIDGGETGVDGFAPWVHGVTYDMQLRNAQGRGTPLSPHGMGPHPLRPSSPRLNPTP